MNANAYYFRVKDSDFFTRIKIEAAKQKISMKQFIVSAIQERLDEQENEPSSMTVTDYANGEGTHLSGPLTNK